AWEGPGYDAREVCAPWAIDMPAQWESDGLSIATIGASAPILPAMASECAKASNGSAAHASNAKISRLRETRERGLSQRRIRVEDNSASTSPQLQFQVVKAQVLPRLNARAVLPPG